MNGIPFRTAKVIVSCILMLVLANVTVAQERFKLTATDAAADDLFGISVSISGDTVIIGATDDNREDSFVGSAYLFDATTGNQFDRLTALDATTNHFFGTSVSISGDTAIIGAYGDRHAGTNSGAAYLFDVQSGEQRFKLVADDAGPEDYFGWSVAISGNTAIVGAFGDRPDGSPKGAAYLFDVTSGQQLAKLIPPDVTNFFGYRVGISGNTAIIGAIHDGHAGTSSGAAYLFDVATGTQLFKLTASDAAANDQFGISVAISGDRAIVGASVDDHDSRVNAGSVYAFDVTTGSQLYKLTASDALSNDQFGWSAAISGNTAIVGAIRDDGIHTNSGSAYVFDLSTGNQLAKFTASDAGAEDFFGSSVAIGATTAVIGAHLNDDAGNNSGSAYVFTIDVPGSTQSNPLLPNTSDAGAFTFENSASGLWFDPPFVPGFRYIMESDSLFTSILEFPDGFAEPFHVIAEGASLGMFAANQSVDFVALLGHGVKDFIVTNISPLVDSEDPMAFPLRIAFDTDVASFRMVAIPEPATPLLAALGLAAGLLWRRKNNHGLHG